MKLEGKGRLLRIFVGEMDKWQGKTLYEAIVLKTREMALAGTSVFRGIEGFGANSKIHTAKILRLSEDLPVLIEIVDTEDKIAGAVVELEKLIESANAGALMTIEQVEIIRYTPARK